MAIEKNNFKVLRFDSEFSMGSRSRDSMSSDDDELRRRSTVDSEDDEEFDDADSGAGSDDFDLLELGESGSEFCQVGDQTCCIPFELYDLADLREILSLDVWNECLNEEERFALTQYLPDMDQETFMHTLKELFEGCNFHFGSPVTKLFEMLKGGLCEPRVALYRHGMNFFQRHQHYHLLRKHQDCMVSNLLQIRDAWQNCKGYSIQEKLRVLNIMRSQKSLQGEKMEDMESDSSEREGSLESLWVKQSKGKNMGQKAGYDSVYRASPPSDFLSPERPVAVEPAKYGKQNPKGLLKWVGSKAPSQKELAAPAHSHRYGHPSLKPSPCGSEAVLPRQGKAPAYDSSAPAQWMRDQMGDEDDMDEPLYRIALQRRRKVSKSSLLDPGGSVKSGKKPKVFKGDEYTVDSYMALPKSTKNDRSAYGGNINVNQLSDIKILTAKPSKMRTSHDGRRGKLLEPPYEDQMRSRKGQASQVLPKGSHPEFSDAVHPYWSRKSPGEMQFIDPSFPYEEWDARSRKLKIGRELPDSKLKSLRTSQQQMNDRIFHPEKRAKPREKIGGTSLKNGGATMASLKGSSMFSRGEETESDSSDQSDEEEDSDPLMRNKLTFSSGLFETSRSTLSKSGFSQKDKLVRKHRKESAHTLDGLPATSGTMGDFGGLVQLLDMEKYSSKNRQKAKVQNVDHLPSARSQVLEDGCFTGLRKSNIEADRKLNHKINKNSQVQEELGATFPLSTLKASPKKRRQKGAIGRDFSPHHSKYMPEYFVDGDASLFETGQLGLSAPNAEENMKDRRDRSDTALVECNSGARKRRGKEGIADMNRQEEPDYLQSTSRQQLDEPTSLTKRIKKKPEADSGCLNLETSEPPITETMVVETELETKPQKKTFTLITPTIHTGFSFSVVHLLSAVRMAMITPNLEDSFEVGNHLEGDDGRQVIEEQNGKHQTINGSQENLDAQNGEQPSIPSLTAQEIVNRVRSNPGDPCILETQEPLQDLVRGALKIFSSKTAPLGAKGWKPLANYDRSKKCWSWVGPVALSSSDPEILEEVTSPDAWGITHKMLVKLVDSFANWLKNGQETLQQIGSLPAPPVELMQVNLDEKERFRDLRAQKSLITISPSSEEVRAYFRKEEQLRYLVPDRAFSYTAADGRKSIVAPLRRCGGKPTSKARDHFMLKRDRPPHVTILCLVRDAAARLPGSIGTRADVCTLIRDSQYIVEDVSDSQVNQVVSGALDRLHYERDPCVQFDGERKLWVYLHRDREEEDFEDDGTSSTKKWKRQKKDASELYDQGTLPGAYNGVGEQSGFDFSGDLNVEPLCTNNNNRMECTNNDNRMEVMYDDTRQCTEDSVKINLVPDQGLLHHPQPMVWEALCLDPMTEEKLLCQQNSTNEDFDDDTFDGERQVGVFGTGL
ncbi:hypothetical protein Ancab_011747 [Ancistrocladus abbreviatus]